MAESQTNEILEDLRFELACGRVVLIIGAGVSLAATDSNDLASWKGLLRHGVRHCRAIKPSLTAEWEKRTLEQIDGDMDEVLAAAHMVAVKLDGPTGGEFGRWLRDTVGSLRITDPAPLKALADLGCPLFTTNYDSLLEQATGLPSVTWKDRAHLFRVLHYQEPTIVHLHGLWERPDSVILDVHSYDQILADEPTKALLNGLLMMRSVLFVGFGAGLRDPHFSALFAWARPNLNVAEHRHFRLASLAEQATLQSEHPAAERIFVLPYGNSLADLTSFLAALAPPNSDIPKPSQSAALSFSETTADIFQRIESLSGRASTLSAGEYLRQLALTLQTLSAAGARRSAWTILNTALQRGITDLEQDDRLQFSLQVAEMMINDSAPDSANSVLQAISEDIAALPVAHPLKTAFIQLQARVFSDLCAFAYAATALREAISLTTDPIARSTLEADLAEMFLLQGDLTNAITAGTQSQ